MKKNQNIMRRIANLFGIRVTRNENTKSEINHSPVQVHNDQNNVINQVIEGNSNNRNEMNKGGPFIIRRKHKSRYNTHNNYPDAFNPFNDNYPTQLNPFEDEYPQQFNPFEDEYPQQFNPFEDEYPQQFNPFENENVTEEINPRCVNNNNDSHDEHPDDEEQEAVPINQNNSPPPQEPEFIKVNLSEENIYDGLQNLFCVEDKLIENKYLITNHDEMRFQPEIKTEKTSSENNLSNRYSKTRSSLSFVKQSISAPDLLKETEDIKIKFLESNLKFQNVQNKETEAPIPKVQRMPQEERARKINRKAPLPPIGAIVLEEKPRKRKRKAPLPPVQTIALEEKAIKIKRKAPLPPTENKSRKVKRKAPQPPTERKSIMVTRKAPSPPLPKTSQALEKPRMHGLRKFFKRIFKKT